MTKRDLEGSPDGQPTFDEVIANAVYDSLADDALPRLLATYPGLSPLLVAPDDVPSLDDAEAALGPLVCAAQPRPERGVMWIVPPSSPPAALRFTSIRVGGLQDARLQALTVEGHVTTVTIGVPRPLDLDGRFALTQRCCATSDGTTCLGGTDEPITAEGAFVAQVTLTRLVATCTLASVTGEGGPRLDVTLESLTPTLDDQFQVTTTLDGDLAGDELSAMVGDVLGSDEAREALARAIERSVDRPDVRQAASGKLSDLAMAQVRARLGR